MTTRNRESIKLTSRKYDTSGLPTRFFNPGELDALLCLFESVNAKTIVEFGVNTGRNPAAAFRNISTLTKYVGVDVLQGYQTQMKVQRNEVPEYPGHLCEHPGFELVLRKTGTFELEPKDFPKADVVFIDADHSRLGVENDTKLARAIVNKGGLIIWHDDNCLPVVEVTQTLNDFCEAGHDIKHIEGTWLAYERL